MTACDDRRPDGPDPRPDCACAEIDCMGRPLERRRLASEIRLFDLVDEQDYRYPGGKRKCKLRRGEPVMRRPEDVTGVTLHQTAQPFGVASYQLRAARGDRDLALARRALDAACHVMSFREPFFTHAHPLLAWVHHGNGFNSSTLGLEVVGKYSGLEDDPDTAPDEAEITTWRGPPQVVTELTVECAREALRYLVTEGRALGCPIRWIYAHRQSSASRRSDPGETLWREVALWGVAELGLETDPALVLGSGKGRGRPVPREWQPDGVGRY